NLAAYEIDSKRRPLAVPVQPRYASALPAVLHDSRIARRACVRREVAIPTTNAIATTTASTPATGVIANASAAPARMPSTMSPADSTPAASHRSTWSTQWRQYGKSRDSALSAAARSRADRATGTEISVSAAAPQHGQSAGIANRREVISTSVADSLIAGLP